jgi:hypothetical protein
MSDLSFFEFYTAAIAGQDRLNVRARFGGEPAGGSGGTTGGASGFIETKGGGGYWEEITRPYLQPLTVWRGAKEAYQHKIPLLLDGWSDDNYIRPAIAEVNEMAGVLNGDEEPPLLLINGSGTVPHDVTHSPNLRWVIKEPPEWGEPTITERGVWVRQAFTVTFMVHNSDLTQRLERNSAAKRPHARAKAGDTFEAIAARPRDKGGLGKAKWGTRLANLNGRQHAHEHLHTGQEVLLPTKQEEAEWERTRRR